MEFSLSQAAKEAGKSKSTINRAIGSGRLSATRLPDGTYRIDAAELFRAFPRNGSEPPQMTQAGTHPEPQDAGAVEAAVMAVRVELLTEQLERERETVADLRRRLDRAEERILALAPPQPPESAGRGLWWRLWGK